MMSSTPTVYAETNFIVELVAKQEEFEHAAEILALAEMGRIALVIPAFSLAEQHDSLDVKWKSRNELLDRVTMAMKDLGRTAEYRQQTGLLSGLSQLLSTKTQEENTEYADILKRLELTVRSIPISAAIITLSRKLNRPGFAGGSIP